MRTLLAILILATAANASPPLCSARFVTDTLVLGTTYTEPLTDVVTVAGRYVSLGGVCPPKRAAVSRGNGQTRLTVTWKTCPGIVGSVTIKAGIDPACVRLIGTITAKRNGVPKTPFSARISYCGDGVWDPGGGEPTCDPGQTFSLCDIVSTASCTSDCRCCDYLTGRCV